MINFILLVYLSTLDLNPYFLHFHYINPVIDVSTGKIIDNNKCNDKNCSMSIEKVFEKNKKSFGFIYSYGKETQPNRHLY
jgi:hypothetical protein